MKKKKALIAFIILICLALVAFLTYYIINREDSETALSIVDKTWIENNKNTVYNVDMLSFIPIYSYKGEGIAFDFLADIEKDTGLDFNPISYSYGTEPASQYSFQMTKVLEENDLVIGTDEYVIVSNGLGKYNSSDELGSLTLGIFDEDLEYASEYLPNTKFKTYTTFKEMMSNIENVDGLVIPKIMYLDDILANNLNIVYNMTDFKSYYILRLGDVEKLNSIIKKYLNKWLNTHFTTLYREYLNVSYFDFKDIDETSKAMFKSKDYVYGFINFSPYDILIGSKLLGVNSLLIKDFSSLSGVDIEIKKYNNISDLVNAFNTNEIDFAFDDYKKYDYNIDVKNTLSIYDEKIVILTPINNNITISSLKSIDDNVNVVADTKLSEVLIESGISVSPCGTIDELISKSNNSSIIAVDYDMYYYNLKKFDKFKVAYQFNLGEDYTFIVRDISNNKIFTDYFNFYLGFINQKYFQNEAYVQVYNIKDYKTLKTIGILLAVVVILLTIVVTLKRKLKNKKRVKKAMSKNDKLKYIDSLTSLKNRTYFNDLVEKWDSSMVYPQAIIMIDLNNVAYINDNFGYQEGDNVIKEAASILISNQIENTEIVRSNGNEFLIYLVGYEEKQVLVYVKKLLRELKNLAHGFGAAAGYSMILDEIKTIDDAVNEATNNMKNNKEESSE